MNKRQNLPNKNIHSNNSSGKPIADNYNVSRQQSPYRTIVEDLQIKKKSRNFSQNRYYQSNSKKKSISK